MLQSAYRDPDKKTSVWATAIAVVVLMGWTAGWTIAGVVLAEFVLNQPGMDIHPVLVYVASFTAVYTAVVSTLKK